MKFRVLGPLQVTGETGQDCTLAPRQARLLAMLLLAEGRLVTREHLIEAVWDDDAPATAAQQLKNLLSGLRQRLIEAGGGGHLIVSHGPGYRVSLADPAQLDSADFAEQVAQARSTLEAGREEQAAAQFREALALWRGDALAGLTGRTLEAAAARLDEQRLATLEQCIDLELRLGRHQRLVAELTELTANHPLRERPVGQLMLALHRCGRQAEALSVYQRLRDRLAGELGVDPGHELQEMHLAVLRHDGAIAAHEPAAPPATSSRRQLPAPARHFTGRVAELKELFSVIGVDGPGGAVTICAVTGSGGIGKTSLALHWAHQVAERFPDGQIYVNLRGFDASGAPATSADAVRQVLEALDVAGERLPVDERELAQLYRASVAGKRLLLLLDNARDADHVRPLLPGTPESLTVVTSRDQLTGLAVADGAHLVSLDLLPAGEAHELLARHLGPERLAAEPQATAGLIARCARLPLALSIVAARAAARPAFPISALVDELGEEAEERLDALDTGDQATRLRAVFSWSYQRLSEPAAGLFRQLGVHPGPEIGLAAAASLCGQPKPHTRRAIAELTRHNLLTERLPGRYALHDLLRSYAAERSAETDVPAERLASLRRVLDHYLHTAVAADRYLSPFRPAIDVEPMSPGATAEPLGGREHARAWFGTEFPALLRAIDRAVESGLDSHVWQLAWSLTGFTGRSGKWRDAVAIADIALLAAQRLGDPAGQANCHRNLAIACIKLADYDRAHANYLRSYELHHEQGDVIGCGRAQIGLAFVFERQGDYRQAIHHTQRALEIYEAAQDRSGTANALNNIGWCHAQLGDFELALDFCRRAFALQESMGDPHNLGITTDSIGFALLNLGRYAEALATFELALDFIEQSGDRHQLAVTLSQCGDCYSALGQVDAARAAWLRAMAVFDDLGLPDSAKLRSKLDSSYS